jgi:hypothetical protein
MRGDPPTPLYPEEMHMKKNPLKTKLTLHSETLRALDKPALQNVAGGLTQQKLQCATQTCRCTFTC